MGKLLKISEAAKYLNVSQDILRKWERAGKISPLKTVGGHRRFDSDELDDLVGKKMPEKKLTYGELYEILCNAQYQAGLLHESGLMEKGLLDRIIGIRTEVGQMYLDNYFGKVAKE